MKVVNRALQVATIAPLLASIYIAYHGIFVMPTQTGVKQDVEDGTCRNPHLYRSHSADSYTGILSIDKQLCVLVEIFTQLLDPIGFKFTQHFLWGLPAFIAIIHLEGVRPDAP
ncbi:hypothetical protein FRC18_011254, partial [Serendipita sp. 400]